MRVAFRVDATERIGGGHAMRCLTLADALREQGLETLFVSAALPQSLRERLVEAGHALHMIAPPDGLERARDDWHEPPLADEMQKRDAAATLAALSGPVDWMVVDHYLLGQPWHSAVGRGAQRVMVIDDLANRELDCDLVLDQTIGRTAADYRTRVPASAHVLAGSSYALLRPEFARERPAALDRRKSSGPVERILISLGTTDIDGITAPALDAVMAAAPECAIDVVLGEQAPSLAHVRDTAARNPRVRLHIGTNDMAALMRDADLSIGAAGTTSWERCCLGLAALTLVLAENQAAMASGLAGVGASLIVNSPEAIEETLSVTISRPDDLLAMSAAAFALVDGLGTVRVLNKIMGRANAGRSPQIRAAIEADSQDLWLWRNDPQTRRASQTSNPIPWPQHERWLSEVLADPERHLLIAESDSDPLGMVRFEPADDGYEVSINIRPDARGEGIGATILALASEQFLRRHEAPLFATVHRDNAPSRRLFEKCGFDHCGAFGERGYHRYVLPMRVRSAERPRSIA